MLKTFSTLYAGHVDFEDMGQHATPVNERRYPNEHLVSVFDKTQAMAQLMDELGYDILWYGDPEPPDAERAPGPRDRATKVRLRL